MSPLPFTICPDCQVEVNANWSRTALEAGPRHYRTALYEMYECEGYSVYLDVLNYFILKDREMA